MGLASILIAVGTFASANVFSQPLDFDQGASPSALLRQARAGAQVAEAPRAASASNVEATRKLFTLANTKGEIKAIGGALGDGAAIDAVDDRTEAGPRYLIGDSETPLLVAARHGYGEIAKFLVDPHKANPHAADRFGQTPLMHAAYHGDQELIGLLIREKADVNALARQGWTPGGARGATSGSTALNRAIFKNHAQAADLLLRNGALVDLPDADGRAPILWALAQAELEGAPDFSALLSTLAARSPGQINTRDGDGNPPLLRFVLERKFLLVKALLSAPNLDVNATGRGGRTALIEAARRGHTETVGVLLDAADIDVNARDGEGGTALIAASQRGATLSVRALVAFTGIDVNLQGPSGAALSEAVRRGHGAVVAELLKAPGIDVNTRGPGGRTPLMEAASRGDAAGLAALLAAPAIDVNARAADGATALHGAAGKGAADCVKALLAAPGIDVNAADGGGRTPLDAARGTGSAEVVGLLVLAGAR